MEAKKEALAAARRASTQARRAYDRRDEAICDAALYASYREIAEVVGLSKPRVAKIVADFRPPAKDVSGLPINLTDEQKVRVEKLIPVYGNDPQAVGEADGTEDDFGDLISETLEALGYRDLIERQAYERVSDVAVRCDAEDLLDWAGVLDLAVKADKALYDELVQTGEGLVAWPRCQKCGTPLWLEDGLIPGHKAPRARRFCIGGKSKPRAYFSGSPTNG